MEVLCKKEVVGSMHYTRRIRNESPKHFQGILQFLTFKSLNELQIDYEWVEQDLSADDEAVPLPEERLTDQIVRILPLKCEPAETFFLLLTDKEKEWQPEAFCEALDIPRIRIASREETMRILETLPEEATVFSVFLDSAREIRIVAERDIVEMDSLLFRDGSSTGFLRIKTADLLERLLPHTGHSVVVIG